MRAGGKMLVKKVVVATEDVRKCHNLVFFNARAYLI